VTQSAFIFGALLAAFVLFLAARDRLSTYAGVIWGAPSAAPLKSSGSGSSGGSTKDAVSAIKSAAELAALVGA
jgi:hypothetical protein